MKKALSLLLVLCFMLSLMPAAALADGMHTVSVRSNDYETGGKSTGSYLSLDSSSLVKTGSFAAGEVVTVHVNMQPGTGFYYFEADDDDIIVTNMVDYSYIEVTKTSDTTYTFVMPDGDVDVSGRFTFIQYTVQIEGYDSGIEGLYSLLTSVNGRTNQNASPFTARYGDSIEIDAYGDAKFVNGIRYTYTENGQSVTRQVEDVQQPNINQYVGTFTMPASDVMISLSTVSTVYLRKGTVTGGTLLMGNDFVLPGTAVTVTGVPSNPDLFDPADAVWDVHGTADPSQKLAYTRDTAEPWKIHFVMPDYDVTVDAAFGLDYVSTSWNGTAVVSENALCDSPIDLAAATDQPGITIGDGNWYYVGSDLTIENRLTIRGTANLILCDGATLTPVLGIQLNGAGELNIWGQTQGTGSLIITKSNDIEDQAGIGGDDGGSAGSLNMHGGKILINGTADGGAGIGGGRNGNGGTVTVYGGEISVKMEREEYGQVYHSEDCAGIGGGEGGSGGTVRVYGGSVYALGGAYGAGIGGGKNGNGGTLEVYGGEVTADAGMYGAGIGGGKNGSGGSVNISGGTVTATSYPSSNAGAGIGGGQGGYGGEVNISGGTVTAKSMYYGAGIGSGEGYEGKAGNVTISGGTVTAIAYNYGAGIGGGEDGGGADVTITGGTVIAIGAKNQIRTIGVAFGKGYNAVENAYAGTLTIYDTATVYAGGKEGEESRVSSDNRIGGCTNFSYARIEPCEHSYGEWAEVDDSTHARTCQYCLEREVEAHSFGDDHICTVCGYLYVVHTHEWGEPIWTWAEDFSTATATFVCENDETHTETVNATITSETTDATCEEAGKTVYTATVTFDGETFTDTKEVTIEAIGHEWGEPTWTWAEDFSTATATFVCENDASHTKTVNATITSETVGRETTYTATVELDGQTYTDTKTVVAPAVTLTFNAGEGTVDPATKEVTPGEAIGELPVPTREGGWVFMGWYTTPAATPFDICQGTEVTAETVIEEDTTVYAHWRLPGDVNGDGKVNSTDVSLLTTFVKARGNGVTIVPFSGDVNGDGKVNSTDVSLLTTYVKARGNGVVLH